MPRSAAQQRPGHRSSVPAVVMAAGALVLSVAVLAPGLVAAKSRGDAECWFIGRTIGSVDWSPSGDAFVMQTGDRVMTDVRLVSWPDLNERLVLPAADHGVTARTSTLDDAGVVHVVGQDLEGLKLWSIKPDGETSEVIIDIEIDGPVLLMDLDWTERGLLAAIASLTDGRSYGQLRWIGPDGSTEPVASAPDEGVLGISASLDGTTLLVDALTDDSGSQFTLVDAEGAVEFPLPEYSYGGVITPDGTRVLYDGHSGMRSRLTDGTDDVAEATIPGDVYQHSPSSRGVIASIRSTNRPMPIDDDSWLVVPELCFSTASWADETAQIPSMPKAGVVEALDLPDPNRMVRALAGRLPAKVNGKVLRYASGDGSSPKPSGVRVADSDFELFTSWVVTAAGGEPGATWTDNATTATWEDIGTMSLGPQLWVVTDGRGDGGRWVEGATDVLLTLHEGLTVEETTVADREARLVRGLRAKDDWAGIAWPATDVYMVSSGPHAFFVTTDDASLAQKLIGKLP